MLRSILPLVILAACERPIEPLQPQSSTAMEPIASNEPASPPVAAVNAPVEEAVAPLPDVDPPASIDAVADSVLVSYNLRHGETLAHFARWSGLPVETIAEAYGLDLDGSYAVGTEDRVPGSPERQGQVEAARERHRDARLDGYLASRGGAMGTEFHPVRTGETAWSIARDSQGIPVWVLEAYNPSVELDTLVPGQSLMVPVLADIVVEADE